MVANRDSIAKIGLPLCDLIIEGRGGDAKVMELAGRLRTMLARSGTYRKQYEDHEERVLHRHLNLFKNKLRDAKTDRERIHWSAKVSIQRQKIAAYEASRSGAVPDLDLDGL